MKKEEGFALARTFRDALQAQGVPVQRVMIFGSVARDQARDDSDLDLAVICTPFASTRHEENMICRRIRWDIDVRIEPVCLHAEDFQKPVFALPIEIEQTGIDV